MADDKKQIPTSGVGGTYPLDAIKGRTGWDAMEMRREAAAGLIPPEEARMKSPPPANEAPSYETVDGHGFFNGKKGAGHLPKDPAAAAHMKQLFAERGVKVPRDVSVASDHGDSGPSSKPHALPPKAASAPGHGTPGNH